MARFDGNAPTWLKVVRVALVLLALSVIVGSFLPVVDTDAWWVRMMDFPRLQLMLAAIALLFLVLWSAGRTLAGMGAALGLAGAAIYHAAKLSPVLIRPALADASEACPAEPFAVMVANVQRGNRRADELIATVRRERPTLFVAQETDEWWDAQLAALSDLYPHTEAAITGSYYGMHVFSAVPIDMSVSYPTNPDTPVIAGIVALPGGAVSVVAIHPRPPHPSQSALPRDAELYRAALAVDRNQPTIVIGDLNAVPWETTVERMRRLGGLLDPRREAGFLASFDAQSAWMKWPLDQVLHTAPLRALNAELHSPFGSDHLPYSVTLCSVPADTLPPAPNAGDRERALDAIEQAGKEAPRAPNGARGADLSRP